MKSSRAEELRQAGLARLRNNEPEEAIESFDAAVREAGDESERELIAIHKSFALITLGRTGPEIVALPRIILRRSNALHVQLAAYNLQYKHRLDGEYERARFYLRIAIEAAEESGDRTWIPELRLESGNLCVFDSKIDEAIEHFEAVLELTPDDQAHRITRAFALQNLGYSRVISDAAAEGIVLIHQAIEMMKQAGADGYLPESYIDLCLGYVEIGEMATARHWGELGLSLATEDRLIRNVRYLLGEIAHTEGDFTTAEAHFRELAAFYPGFSQLPNLLFAIDLRKVVNFKL